MNHRGYLQVKALGKVSMGLIGKNAPKVHMVHICRQRHILLLAIGNGLCIPTDFSGINPALRVIFSTVLHNLGMHNSKQGTNDETGNLLHGRG